MNLPKHVHTPLLTALLAASVPCALLPLATACGGGGSSAAQEQAPSLLQATPRKAPAGTKVTLTGQRLANTTRVAFGQHEAVFTQNSDTELSVTVPDGARSGPIQVTTAHGTTWPGLPFEVVAAPVTLTSFLPTRGASLAQVELRGAQFQQVTEAYFNGVQVPGPLAVAQDGTRLTVTVPAGATTGRISLKTRGGETITSSEAFVVHDPRPAVRAGVNPIVPVDPSGGLLPGGVVRNTEIVWAPNPAPAANPVPVANPVPAANTVLPANADLPANPVPLANVAPPGAAVTATPGVAPGTPFSAGGPVNTGAPVFPVPTGLVLNDTRTPTALAELATQVWSDREQRANSVREAIDGHRAALANRWTALTQANPYHGAGNHAPFNPREEFDAGDARTYDRPRGDAEYTPNLLYLGADPFLSRHNEDIHLLVPEAVSDTEFQAIEAALVATNQVPAGQLADIFRTVNFTRPDVKATARKRLKRLYDEIRTRTAQGRRAEDPRLSQSTPMEEFTLEIGQQGGRCIDGVQHGLGTIEARVFPNGSTGPARHLGDFISSVLTDYKMDFIKRHAAVHPTDYEFPTMIVQNLNQKMLFSLGLRGAFSPLAYPDYALTGRAEFSSDAVMERFLAGGSVRLDHVGIQVDFPAYTVDLMIDLLHAAFERRFADANGHRAPIATCPTSVLDWRTLTEELVDPTDYAPRDPVLGPALQAFEVTNLGEVGNAYFLPPRPGTGPTDYRLTREFWLHALRKYNYIVQ